MYETFYRVTLMSCLPLHVDMVRLVKTLTDTMRPAIEARKRNRIKATYAWLILSFDT